MNLYEKHTHADFCRDALFVQDAVNLRAIARLLVAAADHADNHFGGTEAAWRDPAVVLIVNKIESLVQSNERFSDAYTQCKSISGA